MINNYFSENRAFYEIMRKNMVQPDRRQIAVSLRRRKDAICMTDK